MIMIMKLMIPQKITTSVYLERELEPLFSEVDHFDAEGRLTLEECDSGKVEHVYLPDGLELERKEYVRGILTSRTVYEYDDEGGAVGLSLYDTHGFKMMDESWDWSHDGRVARIGNIFDSVIKHHQAMLLSMKRAHQFLRIRFSIRRMIRIFHRDIR